MMGGTVMALMGGIHYWWPKIWGKMYNETWAAVSAVLVFIGFNTTFIPQFIMGTRGMPRRYYTYLPQYEPLHQLSTYGSWIIAVGFVIMAVYLIHSIFKGKISGSNPWGALTLEWTTSSPAPQHNFARQPIASHGPYDYDTVKAEITFEGTVGYSGPKAVKEEVKN